MSAPWPFSEDEWAAKKAATARLGEALSTSARLRQVEVERDWLLAEAPDEVRERFFALPRESPGRRPTPHLNAVNARLRRVEVERDELLTKLGDLAAAVQNDGYSRVVDDALRDAELVTARVELEQLRAENAKLRARLANRHANKEQA